MDIDGECLCGQVRWEARINPERVALCHCTQCQVTGSAPFRFGVLVRRQNFRLLAGALKVHVKTAESGRRRALWFCPDCGTSIYGTGVDDESVLSLRLGSARQRAELVPRNQMWCRSALPWLARMDEMKRYERQGDEASAPSASSVQPAPPAHVDPR